MCLSKLVVVNFGGGFKVTQSRYDNQPWHISIEISGDVNNSSTYIFK
jgi:hypothetical protein